MAMETERLTAKQERAIVALLHEPNVERAATAARVGQRTLHRWLTQDMFKRAYREARREAFSHAISMTQHYAPMAVQTLAKVMADPQTPAHARVTAAATLLKFGREGVELDELAQRIETLERAAGVTTPSVRTSAWQEQSRAA